MRTGRSNNRGFSIVELIIVVAIMAIVVGVATLSFSIVTNRRVSKYADEIESTMERARVLTLGKEQNAVECIISEDGDEYVAKILQGGSVVSERKIGKNNVSITVYFDNGSSGVALSGITGKSPASTGSGLHFVYDRASGAFIKDVNVNGHYCTKIEISNGSRTAQIIPIGKTGKISRK